MEQRTFLAGKQSLPLDVAVVDSVLLPDLLLVHSFAGSLLECQQAMTIPQLRKNDIR